MSWIACDVTIHPLAIIQVAGSARSIICFCTGEARRDSRLRLRYRGLAGSREVRICLVLMLVSY